MKPIVYNLLADCILKGYMYIGLPWWLTGKDSNLPRQRTWVRSLGWEDPLEEEMATHSYILARKIPRTGEPGWGQKDSDMTLWLSTQAHTRVLVPFEIWNTFTHKTNELQCLGSQAGLGNPLNLFSASELCCDLFRSPVLSLSGALCGEGKREVLQSLNHWFF